MKTPQEITKGSTLLATIRGEFPKSTAIDLEKELHDMIQQALSLGDVSTSKDYQESIDIYSKEGTKVRYTGKGGYDHHKEHADKHLKVGNIYTVDYTDVGNWHTDVYLKEVPNEAFNSVHFVGAE